MSEVALADVNHEHINLVPVSEQPPASPSQYDLCLVLPLTKYHTNNEFQYELSEELAEVLDRIIGCLGRKYVYMYNSEYRKSRFVLLRGGTSRLKTKAEQIGFKVPLNEDTSYLMAFAGDAEKGIKRFEIPHRPEVTPIKPFEFIFGAYKTHPDLEDLYDMSVNRHDEHSSNKSDIAKNLLGTKTIENNKYNLFSKTDRIRILLRILSDSESHSGADVNLHLMYDRGEINGFFALHDSLPDRTKLTKSLMYNALPWKQPLDDINAYFGTRVGYIFAFMSHYVTWLLVPGLLGLGCQISAFVQWDFNRIETVVYAGIMSLWAIFAYEYWKRKEKYLAMYWGTLDSETEDQQYAAASMRASFKGTTIKSYIDGSEIKFHDPKSKNRSYMMSGVAFFFLILVALSAVGVIYFVRTVLFAGYQYLLTQIAASTANAVVIIMLNVIVRKLARMLCNMENHRTDAEYDESVAIKLFVFQFVNSYTSFYYLAFGANFLTGYLVIGDEYDATLSLGVNLAAILIVRSVFGNLMGMFLPWISHSIVKFMRSDKKCRQTCHNCRWFWMSALKKFVCRYLCCRVDLAYDDDTYEEDEVYQQHLAALKAKRERKKKQQKMERGEDVSDDEDDEKEKADTLEADNKKRKEDERDRVARLAPEKEYGYRHIDSSLASEKYADQIMIFGYMTLFVASFPGAVFLGFIAFFLEMRGTLWLMLHGSRRPIPEICETIGHWRSSMEIMIILAVCTNAGVVVFTLTTFDGHEDFWRMSIFVGFQYACFLIMYITQMVVRDEPEEVSIQRQRQRFIIDKLIDRKSDREMLDPKDLL
jgi:hypothetical protein